MTRKIALLTTVPALVWGLSACGPSTMVAGAPPSASTTSPVHTPSAPRATTPPGGESPSATAGAGQAVIAIADFEFTVPDSVAPGARVVITNGDSQAHTVTSRTGGFDVTVVPGGTATLTAPSKPGSYPFVCSFHGNMAGALVVK